MDHKWGENEEPESDESIKTSKWAQTDFVKMVANNDENIQ